MWVKTNMRTGYDNGMAHMRSSCSASTLLALCTYWHLHHTDCHFVLYHTGMI